MVPLRKVVIIGGGGHAKVIIDIIKLDTTVKIVGCTDKMGRGMILNIEILGDDTILPELYNEGIHHAFVAIGDNGLRQRLADRAIEMGFSLVNAISPNAYIADSVQLGFGVAVMAGAVIHADAQLGNYSIVSTNASVDHDCRIGKSCHIAPGCTLSGKVAVGDGTFLGTGTKVIDEISIGSQSVLGAGAVVVNNIPDRCLAVGVPARIIRQWD
jgi:UDP-perosamine 4-acetyltransferase